MNRAGVTLVGLAMIVCASVAMADVVVVVSVKNSLTTLSKSQIADIFLGKTSRFPNGGHAVPIDQIEGSDIRDEFYLTFAGKSPAQLNAHWSKLVFTGRGNPPKVVPNGDEVKKRLAESPDAIGYLDRKLVDGGVKVLLSP